MVFIEIQGYGDFDTLQTRSIWVNPNLPKSFKVERPRLGDVGNDRTPDRIERLLHEQGFKQVHTHKIEFGGNY